MKPLVKARKLYDLGNIFFFVAIFAIALAGDMIWWQTKQMSDDFENSNAALNPIRRSEEMELNLLDANINLIESDANQELDDIELIEE